MRVPLPSFSWANGAEVWQCMLEKDANYAKLHNEHMLDKHPSLVESYRTILFDWLSEVSQECKFHRETYHLALDFIDRYLSSQSNIGKLQLQLIGTTCLFSAAKFEEIRPPTVQEFADLTDGACRVDDILEMEITILSAINWDITPMTPNSWLNLYMQILLSLDSQNETDSTNAAQPIQNNASNKSIKEAQDKQHSTRSQIHIDSLVQSVQQHQPTPPPTPSVSDENSMTCDSSRPKEGTRDDSFILPKNNGILIYNQKRIASVIDLAMLHIESLRYPNSILTAAAVYHFTDELTVRQCTGFMYKDLANCIDWLQPFVDTIKEVENPVFIASCRGQVYPAQMHSHVATTGLLERVASKIEASHNQMKRKASELIEEEVIDSESDSLLTSPVKSTTALLTPPKSTKKARKMH